MKNRILYFLLILVMIVKISLYYEVSINSYKNQTLSHEIVSSYNDSETIKAIQIDRKIITTEVDFLISSLIVIFFINANKNNNIRFEILRIDKRKRIYVSIISKIHGSIYKRKSLIL